MLAKRLEQLNPYVPGEQPKDREYIKLNANENPYEPNPQVIKAVKEALDASPAKLGLYPDPDSNQLRQAIADMLNKTGGCFNNDKNAAAALGFKVTPDMIFCGNGSDEVLSFVFYTFFDSDRPLVLPEHTYSFYPVYCGYYNIPMEKIPLKADWTLDKEEMLAQANKTDSATIFANPNAPTGIALTTSEVEEMIKAAPKDKVFIVDEAYADFGDESCIPLLAKYKNLVIVRTFSKSLSFAGMRLGFIVANPELTASVFTVKNSFNHFPVDFVAQTAGIASCNTVDYNVDNAKKVAAERDSFTEFLRSKGWFVITSKTNFVFAKKEGRTGDEIYQAAKKAGILIRLFKTKGIEDFVRITIGTPQQMAALKEVLGEL